MIGDKDGGGPSVPVVRRSPAVAVELIHKKKADEVTAALTRVLMPLNNSRLTISTMARSLWGIQASRPHSKQRYFSTILQRLRARTERERYLTIVALSPAGSAFASPSAVHAARGRRLSHQLGKVLGGRSPHEVMFSSKDARQWTGPN